MTEYDAQQAAEAAFKRYQRAAQHQDKCVSKHGSKFRPGYTRPAFNGTSLRLTGQVLLIDGRPAKVYDQDDQDICYRYLDNGQEECCGHGDPSIVTVDWTDREAVVLQLRGLMDCGHLMQLDSPSGRDACLAALRTWLVESVGWSVDTTEKMFRQAMVTGHWATVWPEDHTRNLSAVAALQYMRPGMQPTLRPDWLTPEPKQAK